MSSKNYKIFIVDDDPEFHQLIRRAYQREFVFEGALDERGLRDKLAKDEEYDLILLDLILDDSPEKEKVGLGLIEVITGQYPDIPIIVVTSDYKTATTVLAMKKGAKNFLPKEDYEYEYWKSIFLEVIEGQKNKKENKQLRQQIKAYEAQMGYQNPPTYPFIGNSPQMKLLRRSLVDVGNYEDSPDLTILITGETGVGKGVAARFMHYNSRFRKEHPFEEIHISTIPETLLEATLFGAKKGSFTDAKEDIIGRFQHANHGVLFLDEVGDLNAKSQVQLLEFLNNKTIHPLGTTEELVLDVQIVAATNKNLEEEVAEGRFRKDLYHRIKVVHYEIPPLQERREDIRDLLKHFLKLSDVNELDVILTNEVKALFLHKYPWPGNVRELENAVRSAKFHQKMTYRSDKIDINCIPKEIRNFEGSISISLASPQNPTPGTQANPPINRTDIEALSLAEQNAFNTIRSIEEALIIKNGVKKDVAEVLGIKSSDSLRYKIKTTFEKYHHLFAHFPEIKRRFPKIVS